MASLGPHAFFIVASYSAAALVLVGLIGWVVIDYRRQQATLKALEASGVTRRSARESTR
jgi:heme exporter protein D